MTSFRTVWDQNDVVLDKVKTMPFWSQTNQNDVVLISVFEFKKKKSFDVSRLFYINL